jgi:hypothetical protein
MFRVAERYKHEPCALLDPKSGAHIVPDPTRQYADDDPLVLNASWYFVREGEVEVTERESVPIAEVVEQATANPGEKRRVGRPRKGA